MSKKEINESDSKLIIKNGKIYYKKDDSIRIPEKKIPAEKESKEEKPKKINQFELAKSNEKLVLKAMVSIKYWNVKMLLRATNMRYSTLYETLQRLLIKKKIFVKEMKKDPKKKGPKQKYYFK